jgi:hypothetical protein
VIEHSSECVSTVNEMMTDIGLTTSEADSVEIVEETRREIDGSLMVTEIATSAAVVIRRRKSPYWHNKFNYSVIRTFPRNGEMTGIPILETCESLIAACNKLSNEILDNGSLAIQRPMLIRPGSQLREKTINLYAGKLITARPDDIKPLEISDVRQGSFEMLRMFMGFIANISGTPEILDSIQGPANVQTAGGVEQVQNMQTARLKVNQYIDCIALSELFERMASNIQQHIREPKSIPVTDRDGTTHFIQITPEQVVGNFRFYTDIRTMQSTSNSVLRAQLQSLLNISLGLTESYINPDTQQITAKRIADVRELYKELLRQYSIDRPERFVLSPDDMRAYIPTLLPPPMEAMPQPPADPSSMTGQLSPQSPTQTATAGGNTTATGTSGMPPLRGGGQQPAGGFSPQQVPLPATTADANQSATTIQR